MTKQLCGILGLAFLLLGGALWADEEPAPPATLEELQSAILDLMEEHEVPAMGIAMVDENGPVWIGALGKADIERDIDADENSMFRIGSTSKMFVALSVLQLVEQGVLSLDDKVADLAPEIEFDNRWEDTDPIRIVHLLEHTTGWDDIHLPEYAHNDPSAVSLKEALDFHPHSRTSRWKPGSRMSYCNAGPPVAAYIVAKLTGQDFEDYVQEHFFDTLGMHTATYRLSKDVQERGVTLYINGEPQDYWHISMRPSGSINASPIDMARFASFFVNRGSVDGVQLVSEESLRRMETPSSTTAAIAGQETGYGLHNYSSRHKNWNYREHNGGVNGGLTEFSYLPDARVGHAIMINSGNGAAYNQISDLVRDFETRELTKTADLEVPAVAPEHRDIAGLYYSINPRQQVAYFLERVFNIQKLSFDDNTLMLAPLLGGEPVRFVAASPDLYRHAETGAISLSRVVDPLVGPVVHTGMTVLKPASTTLIYGQLVIAALWGLAIVSSVLYAVVWGVRRWRGKIPPGPGIWIRVWPLLAGLFVIAFVTLFSLGIADPFVLLGKPTAISVGIMLTTLLFGVLAATGAYVAVRDRNATMNRVNYWYSTGCAFLHLLVAAYFAWFGVIGLTTWG
ncbi:MAG: beta-lactamase family protein [Gammaproteobacteria bacterium]|nr:beta-lactamase family protein [Gammaproteobacteria bacterium]